MSQRTLLSVSTLLTLGTSLATAQDVRPTELERLGIKGWPTPPALVRAYLDSHRRLFPSNTIVYLCGQTVIDAMATELKARQSGGASPGMNPGDSLVPMPECSVPPIPPDGPRPTILRIDSVVVGREQSFVVARALPQWDGKGTRTISWLTERMVLSHVSQISEWFFTISDWYGWGQRKK